MGKYGNKIVHYTYDSWGKLIYTSGDLADTIGKQNPFRYRSYYQDDKTGYYYLQSRYYDPFNGRFLNADDTDILTEDQDDLLQHNLFAYCLNNPIMLCDDTGEFAISAIIATCLAVAAVVVAITYVNSPQFKQGLASLGSAISSGWSNLKSRFSVANKKTSSPKKSKDSGKNEQHGDSGRAMEKAQKQVDILKKQLAKAKTRREKIQIQNKINRILKDARDKAKGENHSQSKKR